MTGIHHTSSRDARAQAKATWLPVLIGALLCTLVVILVQMINEREQAVLFNRINAEAEYLAAYINAELNNRIPLLQGMAKRWEIRGSTPEAEFITDARNYLADEPGIQAIEWVDRNYRARWIVPLEGNELEKGLDPASDPVRHAAMERARTTGEPAMTLPVDLGQGGKGFLVYFPIHVKGEFDGFIVTLVHIRAWLDHVYGTRIDKAQDGQMDNFGVLVFCDEMRVYKAKGWALLQYSHLKAIADTVFMGHRFSVHVRPTEEFAARNKTLLPLLVALFGFILSVLLAYVVHLLQVAYQAKAAVEYEMERRQTAERESRENEERIRLLLDSTAEAIYGTDLQGNCTFVNPSFLRMLGYPAPEAVLGRNMHQLIHHSHPDGRPMPEPECHIRRAFNEGKGVHRDDEVLWKADGSALPVEYWSYPQVSTGKVTGAVVTFIDITDRKLAQAQIMHMATHDVLTDLPTMRLAEDRLQAAIYRGRRDKTMVAVMFIDLDGFKAVNDVLGHEAGDRVLKEVARRLLACVRETDTVARIGGDEFMFIASEIHEPGNAAMIAGKIIQGVFSPIAIDGREARVGASVGIALYPAHGQDIKTLTAQADKAMYEVKRSGKNNFRFASPPG